MKGIPVALVLFLVCLGASAQSQPPSPGSAARAELGAALGEMSGSALGTLTVGDLERLAARISIAEQQARYVEKVTVASQYLPGVGQFMTGDTSGGLLFLAADLVIVGGTLVGAYFLLPSSVQFSSVDYFHDSLSSIRSSWEGNSIVDYLPSAAAMLGGMILHGILGHVAGTEAAKGARRAIADGKVTFTPNYEFLAGPEWGLRMRY